MSRCPFCDQEIQPTEQESCSHCGQSYELVPLHHYGRPGDLLKQSLDKVKSGLVDPQGLSDLFPHLLGSVQHILNQASVDITENFQKIRRVGDEVPEEARKSTSDFIEDFAEIQEELNTTLGELGDLFGACRTLQEFHLHSQAIDNSLIELQSSVDALGILKNESEISALAEIPRDPIPEEVSVALEYYEQAMECLIRYMEYGQNVAEIAECVNHTDKAKAQLFKLVMMNSIS